MPLVLRAPAARAAQAAPRRCGRGSTLDGARLHHYRRRHGLLLPALSGFLPRTSHSPRPGAGELPARLQLPPVRGALVRSALPLPLPSRDMGKPGQSRLPR